MCGRGFLLSYVASEQLLRSSQCGAWLFMTVTITDNYQHIQKKEILEKKIKIYNILASQPFLMFFRWI